MDRFGSIGMSSTADACWGWFRIEEMELRRGRVLSALEGEGLERSVFE